MDGIAYIVLNDDSHRLLMSLGVAHVSGKRSEPILFTCPAIKVRHGPQLRLVIPGASDIVGYCYRSPPLIQLMVEVLEARQLVVAHSDQTVMSITRITGRLLTRLNELLRLACLSPYIIAAIL